MKKTMLWKITIVTVILFGSGCTTTEKLAAGKPDIPVRWVNAGTLVNVGPDTELSDYPDQLRSSVLGPTKLNRTRVETTEGVYVVSEKVSLAEIGTNVDVGLVTSDEYKDKPKYLSFGGRKYKIVR